MNFFQTPSYNFYTAPPPNQQGQYYYYDDPIDYSQQPAFDLLSSPPQSPVGYFNHQDVALSSDPTDTRNVPQQQPPTAIPVDGMYELHKNESGKYQCQCCDKSYTHGKHLKRHMLRHTGQKPYGCDWCHARFCRPDIRKRHVNNCRVRKERESTSSSSTTSTPTTINFYQPENSGGGSKDDLWKPVNI